MLEQAEHLSDGSLISGGMAPIARVTNDLRDQQNRVLANWAMRMTTLPVFRAAPGMGLDELQRDIPELFEFALAAAEITDPSVDPGPLERAEHLASDHGARRRRESFSLGIVLAEIHVLRREVWAAMWRTVERSPGLLGSLREFESQLGDTFDALAIAAAVAWVDAGPSDR